MEFQCTLSKNDTLWQLPGPWRGMFRKNLDSREGAGARGPGNKAQPSCPVPAAPNTLRSLARGRKLVISAVHPQHCPAQRPRSRDPVSLPGRGPHVHPPGPGCFFAASTDPASLQLLQMQPARCFGDGLNHLHGGSPFPGQSSRSLSF